MLQERILKYIYLILPLAFVVILVSFTFILHNPILGSLVCVGISFVPILLSNPKRTLYFLLAYSFIVRFLVGDLGLPSALNYVCDVLLVLVSFLILTQTKHDSNSSPEFTIFGVIVFVFFAVATFSALLNCVSPLLYLWAVRNTFRLFIMIFCCVRLLSREDILKLTKAATIFYWINFCICLYQYFVIGTGQDNTNGLFGTQSGGNGMMNVLMFTISAIYIFGFVHKRYGQASLIMILTSNCILASLAEIKIYYVELAILVVVSIIINRVSIRSLFTAAILLITIAVGVQVLIYFNPGFKDFFVLDNMIASASEGGYSSEYDLNRLTAVTTLNSMFMDSPLLRAIGLGFGSGQFSQYFQSDLYAVWGETLNWNWFTDAAIFLETGWIGLSLYISAIVSIGVCAFRHRNDAPKFRWILNLSICLSVFCVFLIMYNASLTTDPSCYFIGIILAVPFIFSIKIIDDAPLSESDAITENAMTGLRF